LISENNSGQNIRRKEIPPDTLVDQPAPRDSSLPRRGLSSVICPRRVCLRLCLSEGPACQVRGARLDYPLQFGGHDKHAPPPSERRACQVRFSEGPACRVRCARLDYPFRFNGHDKRAPPRERYKHARIARRLPPKSGGHTLTRTAHALRIFSRPTVTFLVAFRVSTINGA